MLCSLTLILSMLIVNCAILKLNFPKMDTKFFIIIHQSLFGRKNLGQPHLFLKFIFIAGLASMYEKRHFGLLGTVAFRLIVLFMIPCLCFKVKWNSHVCFSGIMAWLWQCINPWRHDIYFLTFFMGFFITFIAHKVSQKKNVGKFPLSPSSRPSSICYFLLSYHTGTACQKIGFLSIWH